ncbi:MAG: hypothetical protein HYV07_00440 [Deltaproteobacteria bacterium]|nr:hypothetical protein [Deltaproteobacteria bacterium]
MTSRLLASLILIAGVACDSRGHFFDLPSVDGAESVLAAVLGRSRAPTEMFAIDAASPEPVTLPLDDAVQLSLSYYAQSLEVLGLEAGAVPLLGAPLTCELLFPLKTLEHELSEESSRWVEAEVSETITEALVPDRRSRCPVCVEFRETLVAIDNRGEDVSFGAWLGSGNALVKTTEPRLYVVDAASAHPVAGCESQYSGVHPAGEDEFWTTISGRLERIHLDEAARRCEVVTSTTAPWTDDMGPIRLAGSGPGEELELFFITGTGKVLRYDGKQFEQLAELEINRVDEVKRGWTFAARIARLGPRSLLAMAGAREVGWWSGGRGETHELDLEPGAHLLAADGLPGGRFIVGSDRGEIWGFGPDQDQGWRDLASPVQSPIGAFAPFRGGVLVTTQPGAVLLRYERGFCPEPHWVSVGGSGLSSYLVGQGERFLLPDLVHPRYGRPEVVWLEPR